MFAVSSIGAACVVFFFVYRSLTWYSLRASRAAIKKRNGCKPPRRYPHKDPILGLDTFLADKAMIKSHSVLACAVQRFETYGDTYALIKFGFRVINTRDPENLKAILSGDFKSYEYGFLRVKAFTPLLGRSIFTLDGKDWEHSRALLRPSFAKAQLGKPEVFETHIQHLLAAIPKDGSMFDLQELFYDFTIDAATDYLLGDSVNTLTSKRTSSGAEFADSFHEAQFIMGNIVRLGPLALLLPKKRCLEVCAKCHAFADRYVKRALEYHKNGVTEKDAEKAEHRTVEKYVFLEELAKETNEAYRIRSEIMSVLMAGRDTTAGALSNLWLELSRHPKVFEKLRAEVLELNGEKPTFERLKSMKYLQWCLNEVLRLYPSNPGNLRVASKDTLLPMGGGPDGKSPLFVHKGQIVMYSFYAMHRREDFWGSDAEEFRPERWNTQKPGWHYLPFSGGPRVCLGQQFALTEIGYTTVRLLQEFKALESRDSRPWVELLTVTIGNRNGCKVALTPA